MKTSELRLGNLIQSGDDIFVVTSLSRNSIGYEHIEGKDAGYGVETIMPGLSCDLEYVPLTDFWLIRFSFKTDGYMYWIDDFCIGFFADGLWFCPTGQVSFKIGKKIAYVHELQNLYFDITNKELRPNL